VYKASSGDSKTKVKVHNDNSKEGKEVEAQSLEGWQLLPLKCN
jgi:hypothetical protein